MLVGDDVHLEYGADSPRPGAVLVLAGLEPASREAICRLYPAAR